MAHMEQALRMDCSLPQLKQACAKMVSKTGLLLKALSERQEKQGASDHMDLCRQQENMPGCMALGEGKKLVGKKAEHSVEMVKFVVLLSLFVILGVMLKVFFHTCLVSSKADSQPGHTRILCLRRFCVKLPEKGRKDNKEAQDVE
ncbi:leucine-rich repeat-containing protein 37B-like [Catharus ustulatus]|uniref:leucine-rich repeat-containing protein 37B-like n=1 Tax=Catharus ustulatus TaxID=91951 RepID=UPI00140CA958|nr:leucine-rich repeat-containing protein 37B-like [Catharus ustulatus]